MKARASEHLGDLLVSEARTKGLQPLDHVGDILRKLIDRLREPDEGLGTLSPNTSLPLGDGSRLDEQVSCGLGDGPASSRSQFEDRQPLVGLVVRAFPRIEAFEACMREPKLLSQEHILRLRLVERSPKSHSGDRRVCGPSATSGENQRRHRGHSDQRGADLLRPVRWQRCDTSRSAAEPQEGSRSTLGSGVWRQSVANTRSSWRTARPISSG